MSGEAATCLTAREPVITVTIFSRSAAALFNSEQRPMCAIRDSLGAIAFHTMQQVNTCPALDASDTR